MLVVIVFMLLVILAFTSRRNNPGMAKILAGVACALALYVVAGGSISSTHVEGKTTVVTVDNP